MIVSLRNIWIISVVETPQIEQEVKARFDLVARSEPTPTHKPQRPHV